ncbi:MAG: AAA family ATPase, partial [Pirellulaceae bacterium]
AKKSKGEVELQKSNIMLIGPTGTGKTLLAQTLAKLLNVPFAMADATTLTEAGYVGEDVENLLLKLLHAADFDIEQAQRGILFIDEIDKIRRQDSGGVRDISGEGVQNALLTMLDGRIADSVDNVKHEPVDTSRILFVCTGAFVGLQGIVERRLGKGEKSKIGFTRRIRENLETIPDQPIYRALCQAVTSDLVEFGMIPEFIGRFATITALHELGRADLRAIVSDSTQGSALERQKKIAELHGIELIITDDALDEIADEAIRLGTGARGLHRLIGRAVDSVDYRWVDLADEGVTRVIIDRQCITDSGKPKLEKAEAKFARFDLDLRQECLSSLPKAPSTNGISGVRSGSAGLPPGITNTSGWSASQIKELLEKVKKESLDWDDTTGSARKWWDAFEQENATRMPLVLRLAEELRNRKATITEFFLSYIYSNTDNILANLHYMDYRRLKEEEERKKRPPSSDK